MYVVSEAFKAATKKTKQRHVLRGAVNGQNFAQSDVVAKSFRITNQLCEKSKIILGGVYVGKLELTFATNYARSIVSRGSWQGIVISPEIGIVLAYGTPEYIPAPAKDYTISEAKWTEQGLHIIAYDNLAKFDKPLDLLESAGKAYDFLSYACDKCGVVLGMSEAECESLVNGSYVFGLYPTDSVKTYRDMLSWLAQACACFALIGRDGKLYLKSLPAPEAEDTINTEQRYTGASFSDFETYYTGLSVVEIDTNTTSYYGLAPDDGLTMNLGANPFLQYGTLAVKNEVRNAILNKLATFRATPFSASMLTNPAYDLGDCLQFTGGIADNNYCVIMQYTFDIDKISVNGFGDNPALMSAQSKTDKALEGLKGQNKDNRITYYTYSNVAPVEIADGDDPETVVNLRFATKEQTTVTLWQEYKLDVQLDDESTPAVITAHYYLDGIEETYVPVHTVGESGNHMLGLQYYLQNVQAGVAHTWTVNFEIEGGSIDIATGDIHVCLSGQGLVGSDSFTGVIEVSDDMPLFVVAALEAGTFTDDARLVLHNNISEVVTDTYDLSEVETVDAPIFTEAVILKLELDTSLSAILGEGFYVGDDIDTGLYNTLYDGGT